MTKRRQPTRLQFPGAPNIDKRWTWTATKSITGAGMQPFTGVSTWASHQDLPRSHLNIVLWCSLALTNAVDVLASRRAYEIGIGEMNPVVSMLLTQYGVLGIALFKGFWLLLLLLLLSRITGWTQKLFACACLIYIALAVYHISYANLLF